MYTQQRAHTYDYKESNLYPGFMPGRLQTAMTSNVKKASAPTHVKQGDGTVKSSYTGQNFQLELSAAGSAISGTSGYNSSGARGMSMSVNSHPNQLLGTNCGNLGGSSDLLELESYGRGIISVAQINNAAFNSKSMQGTSFNSQNYSASKEMYLKIQSNDVMARWSSEKALIAHNGLSMTEHQGNPLYQSESSYASTLSQHWNMNYSTESQSRYVSNNHASMTKSQPLGNLYSGLSSAGHMMGYDGYGNSASYEGKNQQQLLQHQQLQQVQAYNQNSRPQPQQYFDPYSLYVPVQHSQTVENQSNIFEKTNVNSQQPLSAQFVVNSSNAFMSNQHIKPNNDALALNHYFEPKNKPLFNQRLAAGSNASKAHQSTHATPLYGLYHSESNAHYTQHHHALLDANFMHTGIRAPTSFLIQPPNPHAPNAPPSATLSEALHLSCGPDLPSQTPGFATFVTHALLDILGGKVTNQGKPAIVTKSTDSSFGDLNLYVENVLQTTDVSRAMTMLALKYISMLCAESSFRFETGTEKNIIIFGLMLANKILDDHTFTNRTWSDVSKISLEDLNLFEVRELK
ncbi:hypothetical protein BC830DRAFT_1098806 [Chytriomyces sp. MP71]|nr:hypothetical protein BC830DRAFT_1098806 [Chytriomyces sp. MP71]